MQNFFAIVRNAVPVELNTDVRYDSIYTGSGGDVTVIHAHDATNTPQTYVGTPPGQFLPVQAKKVTAAPADALGCVMGIGGRM